VPRSAGPLYHCDDCDVCIRGYDHHCPWTGKCIGEGNILYFYAFVTMIPVYFIFFMIVTVSWTTFIIVFHSHLKLFRLLLWLRYWILWNSRLVIGTYVKALLPLLLIYGSAVEMILYCPLDFLVNMRSLVVSVGNVSILF